MSVTDTEISAGCLELGGNTMNAEQLKQILEDHSLWLGRAD